MAEGGDESGYTVDLYIYDLSQGVIAPMSQALFGKSAPKDICLSLLNTMLDR